MPPPGEGHPCETPEDPTPCQQTQEGDTRDTRGGTQNGGASAALCLQALGGGSQCLCRGEPCEQGTAGTPTQPDGIGRLTQAVGRPQEQEEQREHCAGAWVPRVGVRAAQPRAPVGTHLRLPTAHIPALATAQRQTGRARFPAEHLLCPSGRGEAC